MKATVAVMPLDDRAVNYECVALLGEAAGFRMLLPPKEWLGTPWRAGQMERLAVWLEEAARTADALIVSIETLGYGGLVNSRRSEESVEQVLARLELLQQLHQTRPELTILAYSVLLRISRHNNAEEEKAYWATYGARIFRISVIEDRMQMAIATPAEAAELDQLLSEVPPPIIDDYRRGRARNHAVNRAMIDWTAAGVFDYLIIPQDDTVAYGWNIAEGRALRQCVQQLGLWEKVSIYPGADETDMLLLARYAATLAGFKPALWLYPSGSNVSEIITDFEDRSMVELTKAHLGPLGGTLAKSPDEADILLYVNAPAEGQGNGPDQYALLMTDEQVAALPAPARQAVRDYRAQPQVGTTLKEMFSVRRDLGEFVRHLNRSLAEGRLCALADVAYVNAGDMALGDMLVQQTGVSELAAYAGWNTAGNTLGSTLAQSVIRALQCKEGATTAALAAHTGLLFLRLVEDYLYMSRLRTQVMLEEAPMLGAPASLVNLGEQTEAVRALTEARLQAAAQVLSVARFAGRTLRAGQSEITVGSIEIHNVALPWGRLFDITMEVDVQYD